MKKLALPESVATYPTGTSGLLVFRFLPSEQNGPADFIINWYNEEAAHLCSLLEMIRLGERLSAVGQAGAPLATLLKALVDKNVESPCLWDNPEGGRLQVRLVRQKNTFVILLDEASETPLLPVRRALPTNLTQMASAVVNLLTTVSSHKVDECLRDVLETIAQFLHVDRAALLIYSGDQRKGHCDHRWYRPGITATDYRNIDASQVPWWHGQLVAGCIVSIGSPDDWPPEAAAEKAHLKELGIQATLSVPLVVNGHTQGFLGLDSVEPRVWEEEAVPVLRMLVQGMVSVWQHRKDEERLRRAHQRLQGLRAIEGALLSNLSDKPELAALHHLQKLVPCQRLSIVSIDEATDTAYLEGRLFNGQLELRPGLSFDARYLRQPTLLAGLPFSLPEFPTSTDYFPPGINLYEMGCRSLLVLPFLQQGRISGCLLLIATTPFFFTEEYIDIATEVASQLALVFHQRRLNEQLKRYVDELEQRVAERTRTVTQLTELQQAIFDHTGIGILATDEAGVIQTVNPTLEKMTGFAAQELVGLRKATSLVPFEQLQAKDRLLRQLPELSEHQGEQLLLAYLQAKGSLQLESRLLHQSGESLPVLASISPLFTENKQISGYVKVVTDISSLKKTQEELKATSQRLQLATQAAGQGIWEYDYRADKLYWDERMHQILGTTPLDFPVSTENFLQLLDPDDRARLLADRGTPAQVKNATQSEWRIRRPDGTLCYTENLGIVMHDSAGKIVRALGVVRDVTGRMEAELALQHSEQIFREFSREVDNIFWIHSADTFELLYLNEAFERITGLSKKELAANPHSYFTAVPENHRAELATATQAYFAGQTIDLEFSFYSLEGECRWVHVRSFISRNEDGKAVRYMGIARDITQQKEIENKLRFALEQEKELNALKSGFVSTVSHEFRTPLATIQSSVDLIKMHLFPLGDQRPKAIDRHLGVIDREIQKFSSLLMDVLTLGRLEAGKVSLVQQEACLNTLCEDLIATHFINRADGRRVELRVQGESRLVNLDAKLISHVLVNLLSNAFKFSEGNPGLIIRYEPEAVEVTVSDDGIGIPPEELTQLFDRFFRASNVGTVQGTGLGLAIAKEFVELHKGRLSVKSEVGKGTTFGMRLPMDPKYPT